MSNSIATGNHPGSTAGGSTIIENQVAHGFTILDGIYHNGTSWVAAKADDAETVAVYCVSKVSDADNFEATKFGSITATAHGKTIGEYYFLDANVSGTPTITAPTSGFSNPLFYVEDVDTVHMVVHRAVDVDQVPTSTVNIEEFNSSNFTSYTPTFANLGTPTSVDIKYRRVGDSIEIIGGFISGTVAAGIASLTLPTGLIADTYGNNPMLGICVKQGTNNTISSFLESTTTIGFSTELYVGITGTQFESSRLCSFRVTVPIQGWTSTTPSTKVVTQTEIVNPNILINGDCRVNQRGAFPVGTNLVANNAYYSDRCRTAMTGASLAASASLETTLQPSTLSGSKSVKYTCTTAPATTGLLGSFQLVEDFSLYSGKVVTLSAFVKSNSINARLSIYDGSHHVSSPHSGSGEWEKLSITVTLGSSLTLLWNFIRIMSSTATEVPISDTDENSSGVAAYIEFTGAKLELGPTATDFIADSYGDSLRKCQRYANRVEIYSTAPMESTTQARVNIDFAYNMLRGDSPTIEDYALGLHVFNDPSVGIGSTFGDEANWTASINGGRLIITRGSALASRSTVMFNSGTWFLIEDEL